MDVKKLDAGLKVAKGLESGSIVSKNLLNIVHTANKFDSSIVLHTQGKVIDVKSFLGLSISLQKNEEYKLEIHGQDMENAKKEMADAFKTYGLSVTIL